jgi:hypothetical protein
MELILKSLPLIHFDVLCTLFVGEQFGSGRKLKTAKYLSYSDLTIVKKSQRDHKTWKVSSRFFCVLFLRQMLQTLKSSVRFCDPAGIMRGGAACKRVRIIPAV